MSTSDVDPGVPNPLPMWLSALFPNSLSDAVRLPWGFTNESWQVTLVDGRRLAVTRLAHPRAAGVIPSRVAAMSPRLEAAGLPAPVIVGGPSAWPPNLLVTAFIDGRPGSALLGDSRGARTVGRLCGVAWRRLGLVDTSGLSLPTLWAEAGGLTTVAAGWARRAATGLTATERAYVGKAIASLPLLLAERPVSLVHGDLVPVNILVRDGELAAVLDTESARIGDPVIDVAWFGHIVRYHHPSDYPAVWAGFLETAGIDPYKAPTRALVVLPIILILERMADEEAGTLSDRWLDQLRSAIRVARAAEPVLPIGV